MVVFVHGGLSSAAAWRHVTSDLAASFSCVAVDRSGCGADDTPLRDCSLVKDSRDLARRIDQLDGPVHVVSHSSGVICALEAARRTDNIRRLVAYEPPFPIHAPIVGEPLLSSLREAVAAGDLERAWLLGLRDVVGQTNAEIEAARGARSYARTLAAVPRWVEELAELDRLERGVERFRGISNRVLLLLGTETAPHHAVATRALLAVLPNAQLALLPGHGHLAHATSPKTFADALLAFFRQAPHSAHRVRIARRTTTNANDSSE